MKKFFFAAAIAASALIAAPAMAADIDINLGVAAISQNSAAVVNDVAGSGNISIGSVTGSTVSSTAADINNDVEQTVDVSNLQGVTYGGEAGLAIADQLSSTVNQTAVSLNGEGSVLNSTLTSVAANLNNDAQQHVNVH